MVQFYKAPKSKRGRANKSSQKQASKPSKALSLIYVDTLDYHGRGVALSTAPITIIDGALPHETIAAAVLSESKNVVRAKVIRVETHSSERIEPPCPVYESCGGCNLQHVSAEKGLAHKLDALKRYFTKMLNIDDSVWQAPVLSNIDYSGTTSKMGYRRKLRLAVDARNIEQVKIGYRLKQSNKVIDIADCLVLEPKLRSKIKALLPLLRTFSAIQKVGHIESMLTSDGVVVLINASKSFAKSEIQALDQLSQSEQVRIICTYQAQKLEDLGQHFARLQIVDTTGIPIALNAQDFIQVNAAVNQKMVAQALAWLAPSVDDIVCDFFCGLGNFSLPLAKRSKQVVGYEGSQAMVEQARLNASQNQLDNVQFKAIDLSDSGVLAQLQIAQDELVLLDPSREGAQALCELFLAQKPKRIVYVSCNPNTLIRDLKILSARYKVTALNVLDMFPFTQHLETMTLLERK